MSSYQIAQDIKDLIVRIRGCNEQLRTNQELTPSVVCELFDCNILFAEYTNKYLSFFKSNLSTVVTLDFCRAQINRNSLFTECISALDETEKLSDILNVDLGPTTIASLYLDIKANGRNGKHRTSPESREMPEIKRELLCKLVDTSLRIWSEKQENPDYQYNGQEEFSQISDMVAVYGSDNSVQYGLHIRGLFENIKRNYKYSTPEEAQPAIQKEKK